MYLFQTRYVTSQCHPNTTTTVPIVPIHRSATMYLPLEVIMLLDAACGWQQMNINNVSLLHSVGFVSLIFSLKMTSLMTYMTCQFYAIKIPNSVSDEYYCGHVCLFWNSICDCDSTLWYAKYGSVLLRYRSNWHILQNRIISFNRLVKW